MNILRRCVNQVGFHLYRVTNTRCRIGTVFSPDDGHIVARNMQRKAINILRRCVNQIGFHLYRVTNTRCRIGTVFSPDDGHTVARNTQRKAINILRRCVNQVGSIYKRLYRDAGQQDIKTRTEVYSSFLCRKLDSTKAQRKRNCTQTCYCERTELQ